ncbi:hypothetical protein BDN72DRAFT_904657 [Pluteus cervinus]|uniref:Uncharacterized protein n=1 Tax=Pluteus cervinus TaxID=181527 RepID=A0ACD3A569_9AGAR|nr:hypothetical protein BDN72DRAFT_904657 [Pluteus cervinus]
MTVGTTPLGMQVYTSLAVFLTTTLAIITAAHGVVVERAPVVGGPFCSNEEVAEGVCKSAHDAE